MDPLLFNIYVNDIVRVKEGCRDETEKDIKIMLKLNTNKTKATLINARYVTSIKKDVVEVVPKQVFQYKKLCYEKDLLENRSNRKTVTILEVIHI